MAHIFDLVPNDQEIEAMTAPKNQRVAVELQHRREVKKRLEKRLAAATLQRAIGGDFYSSPYHLNLGLSPWIQAYSYPLLLTNLLNPLYGIKQ